MPHAAPGIVAGCIVVFMLTLGNYLTPTLLGGKNSLWFTEQIYTQFITRFNWEQGAAFGFLLLVLSTAIVWAGLQIVRPAIRRSDAPRVMIPSLPRPAWLRISTVVYALLFFAFLFLPLVVVAVFAFNDAPTRRPPGAASRWTGSSAMPAPSAPGRPVRRRPDAGQPVDQRRGGLLGHRAVGAGRARQRLPARARHFRARRRCRC
jgi:ABC-type Fe3+ transport system permease subunit